MLILNQMTGHRCQIGDHAKLRWAEILTPNTDIMSVRLGRAIPYGGQNGNAMFLLDEDVVFVAERRDGFAFITTVLPKDYAIANMQAGHRHRLGDDVETTKPSNKGDIEALAAEIDELHKQTAEYLVDRRAEVVALRDIVHSNSRKKACGRLMNAIDGELSRRKDIKKQSAHAKRMEDRYKNLKQAMRDHVTEQQYMLILWRADEIERAALEPPAEPQEQVA